MQNKSIKKSKMKYSDEDGYGAVNTHIFKQKYQKKTTSVQKFTKISHNIMISYKRYENMVHVYSTVRYGTVQYSTVQCTQHSRLRYSPVQNGRVQYIILLYSTVYSMFIDLLNE